MAAINHVGISAPPEKHEAVLAFYATALAPLNYTTLFSFPDYRGMGSTETKVPDFWIGKKDATPANQEFHIAFLARGVCLFHFTPLDPSLLAGPRSFAPCEIGELSQPFFTSPPL